MQKNNIDQQTEYLFNREFGENLTDEQEDVLLDEVDAQISEFGWNNTFTSWEKYLFENCRTPESVINFANLFWWYGEQDYPIRDPYTFLGYFYYRIDLNVNKYDPTGILDSLATTVLSKAGYTEANLMLNEDYVPESDPKILAAVELFKRQK